ncbi:MAG TPA: ABC transporter permease [Bryobacteraceae bacterium]|nr:ABC transporter permease [Bryobacteraceae bacterium]
MPDRSVLRRWPAVLGMRVITSLIVLICAGFLATALVRLAPGFGIDERSLDMPYGSSADQQPDAHPGVVSSYADFLLRATRGDFGQSVTFARPVSELVAERAGFTVQSALTGFFGAWCLALALSLGSRLRRGRFLEVLGEGGSSTLLCVPSAVVAFLVVSSGLSVYAGIAVVVFPRAFRFSNALLTQSAKEAYVSGARARGISEIRVLCNHVLREAAPHLITLAGVTLPVAFGAAIPMEVLCDAPGLGQLAWRGALGRDLPLVVTISLLIAAVTLISNTAARAAADCMAAEVR